MGAAASIAFAAGVALGAAWPAPDVVKNALDSVRDAAEEVIVVKNALDSVRDAAEEVIVVKNALDSVRDAAEEVIVYLRSVASSAFDKLKAAAAAVKDKAKEVIVYLRSVASSAFDKLKAAAAIVKDRVIKLVRHLLGGKKAFAASREVDRADSGQDAAHVVLSRASARVARFGQLQHVKALPPPTSSSAVVSATTTAPGGALALLAAPAARAAQRASEMMALVETVVAVLGESISEDARSCISVVVAAVGIGLQAIASAADA